MILLFGSLIYFVGGSLFNKFARHKEGKEEIIPQYDFWAGLPSLVWDGIKFFFGKNCLDVCCFSGKGRANLVAVHSRIYRFG